MPHERESLIVKKVIEQLVRIRLKLGISKNSLSELTGLSRRSIQFIEEGQRNPTLLSLVKIAYALDASLGDILKDAGSCEALSHPMANNSAVTISRPSIESSTDSKEIKRLKAAFLQRYNPNRTIAESVLSGIRASVQHNSLYKPELNSMRREEVRKVWSSILASLLEKYKKPRLVKDYEQDILSLSDRMNADFSDAFHSKPHPKYKTDPGFRISHAQKSISVFLKHLWCMGLVARPPQCPVDRVILEAAGKRYPNTKWGYVNSIDEHRVKIGYIIKAMGDSAESLAEWELMKFQS